MAYAAHAVAMLIVATEHNNAATFDSQLEELEESTDHTAAPVVLNRLEVQARGFRHVHEAVPMEQSIFRAMRMTCMRLLRLLRYPTIM